MRKNIILVSHLGLATGMKKAAEFIVGEQENFYAVELDDSGIVLFKEKIKKLSDDLKEEEIILISDIPSGSPGTTAYTSLTSSEKNISFITGMNLPLVIEILLMRSTKEMEELITDSMTSANSAMTYIRTDLALEEDSDDEYF